MCLNLVCHSATESASIDIEINASTLELMIHPPDKDPTAAKIEAIAKGGAVRMPDGSNGTPIGGNQRRLTLQDQRVSVSTTEALIEVLVAERTRYDALIAMFVEAQVKTARQGDRIDSLLTDLRKQDNELGKTRFERDRLERENHELLVKVETLAYQVQAYEQGTPPYTDDDPIVRAARVVERAKQGLDIPTSTDKL